MSDSIGVLALTAATIGFIHTLIGPDHYIPFIMMQRARGWSRARTLWITAVSGIGHVVGSIVLGAVGVAFGIALQHLELVESVRGELAAWALIAFGLLYAAWGIRRAVRKHPHTHTHVHADGTRHAHDHTHADAHAHVHDAPAATRSITAWTLFTIFVLGPCEPLIPVLMYPAAVASVWGVVLVAGIFSIVTIATMITMVLVVGAGIERIPTGAIERWTHAMAGGVIAASGLAIQVLGV